MWTGITVKVEVRVSVPTGWTHTEEALVDPFGDPHHPDIIFFNTDGERMTHHVKYGLPTVTIKTTEEG